MVDARCTNASIPLGPVRYDLVMAELQYVFFLRRVQHPHKPLTWFLRIPQFFPNEDTEPGHHCEDCTHAWFVEITERYAKLLYRVPGRRLHRELLEAYETLLVLSDYFD